MGTLVSLNPAHTVGKPTTLARPKAHVLCTEIIYFLLDHIIIVLIRSRDKVKRRVNDEDGRVDRRVEEHCTRLRVGPEYPRPSDYFLKYGTRNTCDS